MVLNPDLVYLLDQTCTVFRPSETTVNMVTLQGLTRNETGVPCHIQALSPTEVALGMGYEQAGDYQVFLHSTADLQVGDMLKAATGPHAGKRFWVRGHPTLTDVDGIQHMEAALAYTTETT